MAAECPDYLLCLVLLRRLLPYIHPAHPPRCGETHDGDRRQQVEDGVDALRIREQQPVELRDPGGQQSPYRFRADGARTDTCRVCVKMALPTMLKMAASRFSTNTMKAITAGLWAGVTAFCTEVTPICSPIPRKPNSIWYPIHSAVEVFGFQVDIRPQANGSCCSSNNAEWEIVTDLSHKSARDD